MAQTQPTVLRASRAMALPPEAVWPVITDHETYGRLALNLGRVEATGPNGPDLTRTCYDRLGRRWNETCTLWEDGRRFAIEVDTSDYPYPLAVMRGEWYVEPAEGGSVAGMRFEFLPEPGAKGRTFGVLMRLGFGMVVRRILSGWEREARRRARLP